MKNLTPLLFACLYYAPQISFAQCGTANEPQFITSQADLDDLSGCEFFQGDLNIVGSEITNIEGLASLIAVNGNLNIYDTHITSIDSSLLGSLTSVNEINIYNNQYLSDCCGTLVWQDALDLESISSVNFSSNALGCNSYFDAQATCLGEVLGCMNNTAVNFNSQATLDDGSCLNGVDLQVSVGTILNSLYVVQTPSYDDCLVAEGCFTGTGDRKTLRFTTTISNYGNEDFIIGYEVDDNSQFYYDDCHQHYHYEGYANYQVFNYPELSPSATIGHKNGWCVMDLGGAVTNENPGWNTPGCSASYNCTYMGISAGCSDTYSSGIDCQWVDITDLVDGEYVLAVSTNMETENYSPTPELDFSNNVVYVLFEIQTNDQGETSVVSATEFDGSAINDVCVLDGDATDLGFNFSDEVVVSDQQILFPTSYLNEYYNQSIQFVLTETLNLNGHEVFIDSLLIDSISELPLGVNLACSPQSCLFPIGNSCLGLTGIPEETGSFDVSIAASIYFTDTLGISQQITLPYNGGNEWLDSLLGDNYQIFDLFTPSININVEVPVYGCTDTLALNYSDIATFDDGSCELPNMGCTDSFSLNFNPEANFEDGSCEYCAEGIEWVVQMDLNDTYGNGWNGNYYYIINEWGDTSATGTLEDGSQGVDLFCLAPGCYSVFVQGGNYQDEVTWQITSALFPDVNLTGSSPDSRPFSFLTEGCEFIEGCTQPNAPNYDDQANINDGSCFLSCDIQYQDSHVSRNNDNTSFQYLFDSSEVASLTIVGETETRNSSSNPCWDYIYVYDGEGNQLETLCGSFDQTIVSNDNGITLTWDTDGSVDGYTSNWFINCVVYGCTNVFAENFDALATADDGSCSFSGIPGCVDSLACNFDTLAQQDDGSCYNNDFGCGCDEPAALDGYDCDGNLIPLVCGDSLNNSGYYEYDNNDETAFDFILDSNETAIITIIGQTELYNGVCYDDIQIKDGAGVVLAILGNNPTDDCNFSETIVSNDNGITIQFDSDYVGSPSNDAGIDGTSWSINCVVYGCTNVFAENFDALAMADDGSCSFSGIPGCVDSLACNFDSSAETNDGSCTYAAEGFDCDGNCLEGSNNNIQVYTASLSGTTYSHTNNYGSWTFTHPSGAPIDIEYIDNSSSDVFEGCVPDGCYLISGSVYYSGYYFGYVLNGGELNLLESESVQYLSIGDYSCLTGCMDSSACNFDTLANVDDGSCDLVSCADACGVPNGDNTSCVDACGVPNGDNTSCVDACGVPNGDDSSCADACGIPNGDNSSCTDCAGVVNGYSIEDECGVCDSDSLNNNITCLDCAGIPNGTSVDLGCGCGEPALEPGYDCDGNLIPLVCHDSTNTGYYEYEDNDDSFFEYIYDSTEIALLTITGETEINDDGGCWDYIYIYDGAGIALDTLCGEFNQTILSNDNGITIVFDSDGSISLQNPNNDGYPSLGTSWILECAIQGCMNPYADNYDTLAVVDDGSCLLSVTPGCTDSLACNFDSLADVDDGTCYSNDLGCGCDQPAAELGYDCDGNAIPLVCGDSLNQGNYEYVDNDDTTFEYVFDSSEVAVLTIVGETELYNGTCYDFINIYNFAGTQLATLCGDIDEIIQSDDNGIRIQFVSDYSYSAQSLLIDPSSWTLDCAVQGCMDSVAENYNLLATFDDSTCTYNYGCMDNTACNYDSLATLSNGECIYSPEGFDCDSNCIGVNCFENQDIVLPTGWSIMSSYIQNDEASSMDLVISSIVDVVVIVKNNIGNAYLPDWNFNAIGEWDNTQGYQLKLTNPAVLSLNGTQVNPEETPVNLTAGWNMIAYLREEEADLVSVFNEIVEDIVIVKDFLGAAYLPDWGFNSIGNMTAGQGYQIKMNQANELIYYANGVNYKSNLNQIIDNKVLHIGFNKNTGSNMHLIIPQSAWGNMVADGDEIYVYDTQGATIGAAKVTLPNTVVTLWGNDLLTDQKDGLANGEQWRINLFSVESESLIPLSFELKEDYYGFHQDALVVASQITESFIELKTELFNSVPNPTSNLTEISFYLSKDLDITLRLFNSIGEEIEVISKGPESLGYHSVQLDVSYLEPGIYFYQLESEVGQMTKSLEVIK